MCETIERLVEAVRRAEHVKVLGASLEGGRVLLELSVGVGVSAVLSVGDVRVVEGDFERFVRPARSLRGRFNRVQNAGSLSVATRPTCRRWRCSWCCSRQRRCRPGGGPWREPGSFAGAFCMKWAIWLVFGCTMVSQAVRTACIL
jgi:hypothetical protein